MQINRRLRTFVISLTVILLLLAAGYVALVKLVDLETYREEILAELQTALKRPVSYKSVNLSFSLGPAVSFHGITVKETDGSRDFVTIGHLTFRLDLLPLFKKHLVIHGLVADRPVIRLERRPDGSFNISDLLADSGSPETSLKINQLKLKHAAITYNDTYSQPTPVVTTLTDTDLFLEHLTRGAKGSFKLSTRLQGTSSGTLAVSGKIRTAPHGSPLDMSVIDARISAKKLDPAGFWPYYRGTVPFKKPAGSVDMETEIHGRLGEFTSSGKITLTGGRLDYQPVFKQPLAAKSIQLKYSLELNKADISLKAVEVNIDGAEVKGSFALRDYRGKDPRITAQAVTTRLDYAKYSQYIPYGIIVKDTSAWIEQHLAGGIYQLDEGKLDGRVSQILHMETGENYNVLYIKARVEKGVVTYGSSAPTFNQIKGTLELKGKDFFLHGMSGSFGTSPLTLEGRITDYPLDRPSSYPFRMAISPTRNELNWLLGKERAQQLTYNGNSSLTLSGEGFTTLYHLTGDWSLAPAAYSYGHYVTKPAGTPSQLKFKGSITPKEAVVSSLNYTLAGLNLDLATRYQFDQSKPVELQVNTNQFSMETIAPLSPYLNRYQPSGRVQLSLRGSRPPAADDFKWRGSVALTNASLRYSPNAKAVTEATGAINFNDNYLESSQLSAKIGTTLLTGKGTVNSLHPVTFSTSFSSPRLDLADFGFTVPHKNGQITKVRGDISFKENSLTIRTLSGSINKSQLTIKGVVSDMELLKADLAVTAPYLDLADLLLLDGIEKTGAKPSRPAASPALRAVVRADRALAGGLELEQLSTTLNLANQTLLVQSLEADLLGGRLTAKGKIETQPAPPRFQGDFRLASASADQITEFLSGEKREITGVMSLEGAFSASGSGTDAIKKSAAGNIKVHATKGMLRRFSGLSKVFSILNVSQLFKLKLPDMVSEGMPYTEINGSFVIGGGSISTSDLFISSNAMNMSFVGKHDFITDNIDMTVGIQPLQTVDKIVSHIPIVGWILTGKDKSLITTYFEIKGKATAPQVSAIPVTSLGRGVLGIFKRVFQLPAKLFTDTGEVILGN